MTTPNDTLCEALDDYLEGALAPREAARFESHVASCTACREAVDEQRWIDGLLRSDQAAELEAAPVPATIPIAKLRRRRVVALAAAAAVLAATAAILLPLPRRDGSNRARSPVATERRAVAAPRGDAALAATDGNPSPNSSLQGRGNKEPATFVSAGSSIAIPVASDDPQVTIVKLYPTVTATRRWQREAELREPVFPPNGG